MGLILSIDTAFEHASVCISEDASVIATRSNSSQPDHAAWIQTAIREMFKETNVEISQLASVAVTTGPGSYTGLRVGMATAKGICYVLKVPLITESTLMLIARRARKEWQDKDDAGVGLLCPMIDARRMEVFTSLYDLELTEKVAPSAIILDNQSFSKELEASRVIFCGNGIKKWQNLCLHPNAVFLEGCYNISDLAETASKKLGKKEFSDLAYAEPAYIKSVYTGKIK